MWTESGMSLTNPFKLFATTNVVLFGLLGYMVMMPAFTR